MENKTTKKPTGRPRQEIEHYTVTNIPVERPPSDSQCNPIGSNDPPTIQQAKTKRIGNKVIVVILLLSIAMMSAFVGYIIQPANSKAVESVHPDIDFCKLFGLSDAEARQLIKKNIVIKGNTLVEFGSPCLPPFAFDNLDPSKLGLIKRLEITNNGLLALSKDAFTHFNAENVIEVIFRDIKHSLELPSMVFDSFSSLKTFEVLSSPGLILEEDIFGKNRDNIKTIIINFSEISTIPSMMKHITNFHILDLQFNNIASLEEGVFKQGTSIDILRLTNNPIASLGEEYIRDSLDATIDIVITT